jgi:Fe-S oxidoreductase
LLSRFDLKPVLRQAGVELATPQRLATLTPEQRQRSVILVQDAFTRYFDTQVVGDWIRLIRRLGYQPWLAPFSANGKPLQVLGFLGAFAKAARTNARRLQALSGFDIPLLGLDPAMTLVYRQEYQKLLGQQAAPQVLLPQEWLAGLPLAQIAGPSTAGTGAYKLLAHCTEKTNAPASTALWPSIFQALGLELQVLASGCCGMSGTYGHEARNLATSQQIFSQSWQPLLQQHGASGQVLANGYSCRSQAARLQHLALQHPLQALLRHLDTQPT